MKDRLQRSRKAVHPSRKNEAFHSQRAGTWEALVNSQQEILEKLQEQEASYSQELNQIQEWLMLRWNQKVSFAGENLSRIHQEEAAMRR